jgi:hypothetical protein
MLVHSAHVHSKTSDSHAVMSQNLHRARDAVPPLQPSRCSAHACMVDRAKVTAAGTWARPAQDNAMS